MESLSIGEMARRAGVGVETIRYYERRGLLADPPRTEAGHRRYASEQLERLQFIRYAKAMGFSLSEIGRLLELRRRPSCEDLRDLLRAKLDAVAERLGELHLLKQRLEHLVVACERAESDVGCSAIDLIVGPELRDCRER